MLDLSSLPIRQDLPDAKSLKNVTVYYTTPVDLTDFLVHVDREIV
jgi:hypothetical protein